MVKKLKEHGQRAMQSKYGKVLVVAFFIPDVGAAVGLGWGLLQHFIP